MNRLPPQNLAAEQAILGAILLDNSVLDRIVLKPEEFYRTSHRQIYSAMVELARQRQPIDAITLSEKLHTKNQLEEIGGRSYLVELNDCIPTAAGVQAYIKTVKDKAKLIALIKTAEAILSDAYEDRNEADVVIADATRKIFDLSRKDTASDLCPFEDYSNLSNQSLVFTGIKPLDDKLRGLTGLTILGGETGVNKTNLVWQIALHWANLGHPVNVWDIEMGKARLKERMPQQVPRNLWYTSNPSKMSFASLQDHIARAGRPEAPLLHIVDSLQALVVDYEERRNDIDKWVNWFVRLKLVHPVVFLAVSEMSREGKLKESGEIEYRADVVLRLMGVGDKRTLKVDKDRMGRKGYKCCDFRIPVEGFNWQLTVEN